MMKIDYSFKVYVNHIKVQVPCGSLQFINVLLEEENTTWTISVHEALYLNITFVRFHLETSSWCLYSYMYIVFSYGNPKVMHNIKHCGTKPQWTALLPTHHVEVCLLLILDQPTSVIFN